MSGNKAGIDLNMIRQLKAGKPDRLRRKDHDLQPPRAQRKSRDEVPVSEDRKDDRADNEPKDYPPSDNEPKEEQRQSARNWEPGSDIDESDDGYDVEAPPLTPRKSRKRHAKRPVELEGQNPHQTLILKIAVVVGLVLLIGWTIAASDPMEKREISTLRKKTVNKKSKSNKNKTKKKQTPAPKSDPEKAKTGTDDPETRTQKPPLLKQKNSGRYDSDSSSESSEPEEGSRLDTRVVEEFDLVYEKMRYHFKRDDGADIVVDGGPINKNSRCKKQISMKDKGYLTEERRFSLTTMWEQLESGSWEEATMSSNKRFEMTLCCVTIDSKTYWLLEEKDGKATPDRDAPVAYSVTTRWTEKYFVQLVEDGDKNVIRADKEWFQPKFELDKDGQRIKRLKDYREEWKRTIKRFKIGYP